MPVRVSGLSGSGLPPNLVDQVIEAEKIPIKTMQDQKTKIEDKVKLVGEFETKIRDINKDISTMMGAKGFSDKKFNSSFPELISGTIDPSLAEVGDWTLEVTQLAGKPSVVSNGVPDKDQTKLGVGYIKFDTADGAKEVYISEENSTLGKIAEAINSASLGVRAVVVEDRSDKDNSFKLEISGMKTGDDHEVVFPTIYLIDGDQDFQFENNMKAQNAKFKLDGHEFEVADNLVKDIIPGVTLDLKRAQPGQQVRLNVTENFEAIGGKIKNFVDAYNGALSFIQAQSKLAPDAQGNQHMGPLGGDGMLRSAQAKLRSIIQDPQMTDSKFKRIIELGVEFNRNGTLTLNQDKFNKIVNSEPEEVSKFFRGDRVNTGFITQMTKRVNELVDTQNGPVGTRKKSYQDRISQMDQRIQQKERQVAKKEEAIRRQFAQMDEAISRLQSQTASVASLGGKG